MITKWTTAAALVLALGCGSTLGDHEDESVQGLETTTTSTTLRVSMKASEGPWGRQHFYEIADGSVHLFRSRTQRTRADVDTDLATLLDGAKNDSLLLSIEPQGQVEPTWYFSARAVSADRDDNALGTSGFFKTRVLAEQASKDLQRALKVTSPRVVD